MHTAPRASWGARIPGIPVGARGKVSAPPSFTTPGCPQPPRALGPLAGGAQLIGQRREARAEVCKYLLG